MFTMVSPFFSDGTATGSTQITAAKPAFRDLVAQDRMQSLLDRLRSPDYQGAARDLLAHGPAAIPPLLEALAWRDMEMRRRAYEVLQRLWPGVPFDPFAPEAERLRLLQALRTDMERRAG